MAKLKTSGGKDKLVKKIDRYCPKSDPWYSKFEHKVDRLIGDLKDNATQKVAVS